ncbi:hypothetical protein PF007_g18019 [Phytophthora fragariae]|uniref:Uncharacterized protein n=1 Tax=Phytophthora fragariae TaxID=53985 RepID=A0A6A3RE00_9STRA|nr:hypothetical protein PF007_g18019 [Phytophthora fragariae]
MGDILIAEWLVEQGAEWRQVSDVIDGYVANQGRLDVLQWLYARGQIEKDLLLMLSAANGGHFHVARWVIEVIEPHDGGTRIDTFPAVVFAIHTAASHGHLEIAKFLRECTKEVDASELEGLDGVVVIGSIEFVSGKTMREAAEKGCLDVVQWLYHEYGHDVDLFVNNDGTPTNAIDGAAGNGHLEVVQYLHGFPNSSDLASRKRKRGDESAIRSVPTCTEAAMNAAASHGHLAVVQWLHENRTEGCSTVAMDDAAASGHLRVLQWLHEHRTEGCTTAAMKNAARYGHLEVVRWLHYNTRVGWVYERSYGRRGDEWTSKHREMAACASIGRMHCRCDELSCRTWRVRRRKMASRESE